MREPGDRNDRVRCRVPLATDNEDLANIPGMASVQEVIVEDDGDGVDSDPYGMLVNSTVDLDPSTPLVNDKTLVVLGRKTDKKKMVWECDVHPEVGLQ